MKNEIIASRNLLLIRRSGVLLGLLMLIVACGSLSGNKDTRETENYIELQNLVDSREFEIENQWATPLRGNRINLIGNPNFVRFKGDSVNLFLPYFGVRHTGGGYGTEGGIKYEGIAEDLKIVENLDNIVLQFEGNQNSENLRFYVTLFPNRSTSISVNSSQRDAISYQGEIGELPEEAR